MKPVIARWRLSRRSVRLPSASLVNPTVLLRVFFATTSDARSDGCAGVRVTGLAVTLMPRKCGTVSGFVDGHSSLPSWMIGFGLSVERMDKIRREEF